MAVAARGRYASRMPRWLWITLALAAAALVWGGSRHSSPSVVAVSASAPAGCDLPPPLRDIGPLQIDGVDRHMPPFRMGDFHVQPLAGFSLEARVLGRQDYRFERGAALAPTDLALGWGRMTDPAVYEPLEITQSGRWYRYRWDSDGPPIPLDEIVSSSANMHMVPANDTVARALANVRAGQMVRVQGWLIDVRDDEGWRWTSSLTRDDSGDGACELVYVCALSSF